MKTIRQQLLLWLLGGTLLCTLAAGLATYLQVREEADELFDTQLRQIAASFPAHATSPAPHESDPEEDIVVEAWDATGRRSYASHPSIALPRASYIGYSRVTARGRRWRVFAAQHDGRFVQVAQELNARDRLVFGVALRSLVPFLVLIPVLGVLIVLVVGRSLRPLGRVAEAVTRRSADALHPIPAQDLPPDILPVVAALNSLLGRLEQAIQSQKNFVADAAHELRTPLTALKLQLELAEQAAPGTERGADFARLHQRLDRASHLVAQLLTLAREGPESGERPREDVDLAQLARDTVAEYDALAERRDIDLGVEAQPLGVSLRGERDALRILLGNLVDNALRYTPAGGRVDVTVRSRGERAELAVVDSGEGIPAEERERVFDRFYRRNETTSPGAGLGLAIVRSIAKRHGAVVCLDDNPAGRGLVISVVFPADACYQRLPKPTMNP